MTIGVTYESSTCPCPSVFHIHTRTEVSKRTRAPAPLQCSEGYEVYAVVLPDECNAKFSKKLLIAEETANFGMCLEPDRQIEAAFRPAMTEFVEGNRQSWVLQPKIKINFPYELIPKENLLSCFKKDGIGGWQKFRESYSESDGWIELSAVGF